MMKTVPKKPKEPTSREIEIQSLKMDLARLSLNGKMDILRWLTGEAEREALWVYGTPGEA